MFNNKIFSLLSKPNFYVVLSFFSSSLVALAVADASDSQSVDQFSRPVSKRVGANDDLRFAIESAQPGEHILILPGHYQIAQTIKVPSGVTITESKFRTGVMTH